MPADRFEALLRAALLQLRRERLERLLSFEALPPEAAPNSSKPKPIRDRN